MLRQSLGLESFGGVRPSMEQSPLVMGGDPGADAGAR